MSISELCPAAKPQYISDSSLSSATNRPPNNGFGFGCGAYRLAHWIRILWTLYTRHLPVALYTAPHFERPLTRIQGASPSSPVSALSTLTSAYVFGVISSVYISNHIHQKAEASPPRNKLARQSSSSSGILAPVFVCTRMGRPAWVPATKVQYNKLLNARACGIRTRAPQVFVPWQNLGRRVE